MHVIAFDPLLSDAEIAALAAAQQAAEDLEANADRLVVVTALNQ